MGWAEGQKKTSPDTPNVFRDGKGRGGDDGAGRLVRHELQDHQTPRDDFAPAALVLAPRDPVVPVRLGIVLLGVKDRAVDDLRDVVVAVVAENERHRLTLADVDAGDDAFAQHAWLLDLLEADAGPALLAILATVHADVELELDVLAAEGGRLALRTVRDGIFLQDGGGVWLCGIIKRGEELDL